MEEHAAAVVPDAVADLIDENGFGAGNGNTGRIEGKTSETIMIGAGVERGRTNCGTANDGARGDPGVIDEDVVIRGVTGMKSEIEQAGIVPALALIAEVENKSFGGGVGIVDERPDAAFAFPNEEAGIAGHGGEAEGIGEEKIGKSDHGGPISRDGKRGFGQLAVEKRANGRLGLQAVGLNSETDLRIGSDGVWSAGEIADVIYGDSVVAVERKWRD